MTVQQMKQRFGLHPHADPKDGVTMPAPPQGLRGPLPASRSHPGPARRFSDDAQRSVVVQYARSQGLVGSS